MLSYSFQTGQDIPRSWLLQGTLEELKNARAIGSRRLSPSLQHCQARSMDASRRAILDSIVPRAKAWQSVVPSVCLHPWKISQLAAGVFNGPNVKFRRGARTLTL